MFNGVDNMVTVLRAAALNLTTGMTVEGVGLSDGADELAQRRAEGRVERSGVRALCQRRDRETRRRHQHRSGHPRRQRHRHAAAQRLVAPGDHVRRHDPAAVRQRCPSRQSRGGRDAGADVRRVPDRRQQGVGRVVQRRDRRHAGLQPRAEHHRNPDRHEHAGGAAPG